MTDRSRLPLRLAPLLALLLLGAVVAPATWAQDQDGSASDGMGEGTELRSSYDEVLDEEAKLEEAVDLAATRRAQLLVDIATVQRELDATRAEARRGHPVCCRRRVRKRRRRPRRLAGGERRLTRATEQLHAQAVSSYVDRGDRATRCSRCSSAAPGDVSATGRTLSYATAVVDHQGEVIDAFNAARRERNRLADRAESAAGPPPTPATGSPRSRRTRRRRRRTSSTWRPRRTRRRATRSSRSSSSAAARSRSRRASSPSRRSPTASAILLAAHQAKQKDYKAGEHRASSRRSRTFDLGSRFGMRVHPILHYERLHAGVDLERAERHRDPGRRQGQGGRGRAEGRLRQLRRDLPRVRHRHRVRAPVRACSCSLATR